MPARMLDAEKVRSALLTDTRFNHPDAAAIADRYLPRLIVLSRRRVIKAYDTTYTDILWFQISLGLEALANGYPHLPKSDDQKDIVDSLKRSVAKQQHELGRLPRVSHENIELGNLAGILSLPLVEVLNRDLKVPFKDFIESDPGCILSVLVAYWQR